MTGPRPYPLINRDRVAKFLTHPTYSSVSVGPVFGIGDDESALVAIGESDGGRVPVVFVRDAVGDRDPTGGSGLERRSDEVKIALDAAAADGVDDTDGVFAANGVVDAESADVAVGDRDVSDVCSMLLVDAFVSPTEVDITAAADTTNATRHIFSSLSPVVRRRPKGSSRRKNEKWGARARTFEA